MSLCISQEADRFIFQMIVMIVGDDEEIQLTNKEYELLLLFARNPGIALYKETIYERVWGGEYVPGSRTVELHIQRMRKKVGWEKALITIPKVGYRLVDTT